MTQTVTVTVLLPPTITSFGASPATIALNASSSLTGRFFCERHGRDHAGKSVCHQRYAGECGARRRQPFSTLTVTPSQGTAITQTTTVSILCELGIGKRVEQRASSATDQILGMNLAAWCMT